VQTKPQVLDHVNVHNTSEVLCANTDPQRDSIFIPLSRNPADVLDHAPSEIAIGTKLGIDATRKSAAWMTLASGASARKETRHLQHG